MTAINIGLEGIVVGRTAISEVDGERGRLSYRGHDISSLVRRPFLQNVWLLLFGEFPGSRQEQQLAHFLLAHRHLDSSEQALLAAVPLRAHPMQMLQAMVPLLNLEPRSEPPRPALAGDALQGLIISARLPTLIAGFYNRQAGRGLPPRCNSIDPHRAFLKALHGREPTPLQVSALERAQILQLEHGYNAGTFAGRVALSTRACIAASIAASIGTLSGSLHGGADEAALAFAQRVGSPQAADAAVSAELAAGRRIMGMGHREYAVVDPRASLLKPLAAELCAGDAEHARLLATLEAVEQACSRQLAGKLARPLHANVEFYKGAVFHALGLPGHFFTAAFAMARVIGYVAHAIEFRPEARLIRPRAEYCGPAIR